MASKLTKDSFTKHRPTDPSDPGFKIRGHQVRWLGGRHQELRPGRIWQVIKKTDLPPELVEHVERMMPAAFAAGDTLRKGDQTLGYATIEAAAQYRQELAEAAAQRQKAITAVGRGITAEHVVEGVAQGVDAFRKRVSE